METEKIVLLVIALAVGIYAVVGILQGKIYCKGGPYSRSTEPGKFWGSVAVYLGWFAMLLYFLFIRGIGHQ